MVCQFCSFQNSFNGSFSIQPEQRFFAIYPTPCLIRSSTDGFHPMTLSVKEESEKEKENQCFYFYFLFLRSFFR